MNVQNWPSLEGLGRHPALETLAVGRPDGEAIDAFLDGQEFPLAEPGTLTFAWRGAAEHVDLVRWIHGGADRRPFAQLAGTDLWLLRLPVEDGGRFEYKLAVGRHGQRGAGSSIRCNPARAGRSVRRELGGAHARLRAAGVEPAARRAGGADRDDRGREPGLRRGARACGSTCRPGTIRSGRYPLVVVHDGERLRHLRRPAGGARQPDRRRRDPAGDRGAGADPRPARANIPAAGSMPRFLASELLPALAARWRISRGARRAGAARREPRGGGLARHRLPLSRRLRRAGAEVGLVHPRRAQARAPAAPGLPPHRPADAGAPPRAAAAADAGLRLDRRARGAGRARTGRLQASCANAASMFCSRARGTATTGTTGATSSATGCGGCCGRESTETG